MAEFDVTIVGAGPAGLSAATELGMRGVRCLVVERNDRVGYAPRAKTTNVRTRTHFRRWGIADNLAAASPFGVDYPSTVLFVTRLSGKELARIPNAFNASPERHPFYPEHAQWIPQYKVEEVLRAHLATLPNVSVHFSTEFVDAVQDGRAVRARLKDRTSTTEWMAESRYLIGADGARSRVRDLIGAKLEGVYGLSRNYNIVFRGPGLMEAHHHGPAIMYWHINADAPALLGPMDQGDKWFFMPTKLPEDVRLSDGEAVALIKKSTGIDLPFEPLSNDEWVASRFIADKYRSNRIFLVGDACHLHPPFGGYGMNMGIGDAVDLGWKLAANLQGWGGPALMESYAIERRQVHEFILDEAVANHAILGNQFLQPGIEDTSLEGERLRSEARIHIEQAKKREFHTLGAVLGYRYQASPVIVPDGTSAPPLGVQSYIPSARPGHLAPHAWLQDGRSLYDLFGPGFTLLVAPNTDRAELVRALSDANQRRLPFAVVNLEPVVAALYDRRLTMVRPDQHVAWRGDRWPGPSILDIVTGFGV